MNNSRERRVNMPSLSSGRIDDGLRELSREVLPPGHMHAMLERARVRVRRKEKMNTAIRRMAVAAGLCAAILVGLVFVPVSYDLRVGTLVRAEMPATDANLAILADGLPHMEGLVTSSAEHVEDGVVLRLGFWGKSTDEARAIANAALADFPRGPGGVRVSTVDIIETIGGNVLAWASGGRIVVNGEGMTEEELEQAIVQALIDNGASRADVNVELVGDGISRIDITVGEMDGTMVGDSLTIEIINSSEGGSTIKCE
jgi:hypothetical protein